MGGSSSHGGLDGVQERARACVGAPSISGRFHCLPKTLQDDYVVEKTVLGTGYNGAVRLATNRLSGRRFAMKSFDLDKMTPAQRKESELECEIFLCMDHPHVVRLVDAYESETQLDLVMECLAGGELLKRVTEKKRFAEVDARDASWQMLLAINYIHFKNVVHRDIKLQNWMFDEECSDHLKLIDFGFSTRWTPNAMMTEACGTMPYMAPEVLKQRYASQCDMWSIGVTVFVLLFGCMPFSGQQRQMRTSMFRGDYVVKSWHRSTVSQEAQDFVKQLLVVDPKQRLTAKQALEHSWIKSRDELERSYNSVDETIVNALASFAHASQFRRAAMYMMAWSLTNIERAQVRNAFINMDVNRRGVISTSEFKQVFEEHLQIDGEQAAQACKALDAEIHYTDFLAAMVSSQIQVHEELLQAAFKRFDIDSSGYITKDNLQTVLGDLCCPDLASAMIWDVDSSKDMQISYEEFASYLLDADASIDHQEAAAIMVDKDTKPGLQELEQVSIDHREPAAFKVVRNTKPGLPILELAKMNAPQCCCCMQ